MFNLLKSYENQNYIPNCLSSGICTTDPTLNALEELLLNEIKQIAFYVVKLEELGQTDAEIMSDTVDILAIELLNTNFSEKGYQEVLLKLIDHKNKMKKSYIDYCKKTPASSICGVIHTTAPSHISEKSSITKMIKEGEKLLNANQKSLNDEKIGLTKLITLQCKISARNIVRIKGFEPDFTDCDFEILRLIYLKNFPTMREEKLKRRIMEFARIASTIQQKLINVLKQNYGIRETVKVLTSAKEGKSILVSGTDAKELEKLLLAIGDRPVNVYTHNELIRTHSYPGFQKFEKLVGHWGEDSTQHDFVHFKGVVYLTKNSDQKVDNFYRSLIYSSEPVVAKGVVKVINDDFEPLIQAALKHEGFSQDEPETYVTLERNDKKINEILATEKEIVAFLSNGEKNLEFKSKIGDKTVINLQYPSDLDVLHKIIKKSKENNIKTTIFFTRCEPTMIGMLLILAENDINEIYLSKCPLNIVNPHVIDCLKNDFGVKIIT